MHVLGAPIQAISGTTGRLARENAKRNPKRTSATASALMIGVALVGFITILASSTKASISDTLSKSLQADYVVASGSFGNGGLSPEIEADLSALPEVAAVSPLRTSPIAVGDGSSMVAAVDTRVIDQLADLGVTDGRMADVTGASVAVEDRKAKADGLAVGDKVTLTFARTGPVELTVRALFDRPPPGADGTVYVVGLDTYEANVTDQFDRQVFVKVADGVSPAQAKAALDTVLARWPNGELQDQAAFKESITSQIDIILNLIYGLLALAIVIALIGIANTLALSVHERRRELGLLRAVGMTRPQVRSAIRWESVMIALMGTFLGFALAVAGSWGIVSAIEGDRPMTAGGAAGAADGDRGPGRGGRGAGGGRSRPPGGQARHPGRHRQPLTPHAHWPRARLRFGGGVPLRRRRRRRRFAGASWPSGTAGTSGPEPPPGPRRWWRPASRAGSPSSLLGMATPTVLRRRISGHPLPPGVTGGDVVGRGPVGDRAAVQLAGQPHLARRRPVQLVGHADVAVHPEVAPATAGAGTAASRRSPPPA